MKSVDYLEAEAKNAERSATVTTILGIVVAVFTTGYLTWIDSSVEEVVKPTVIADLAVGAAGEQIPEIADRLKQDLLTAAPQLASTLTGALVDAIGTQRAHLESSLLATSDEMAQASARDVGQRLDLLLTADKGAGSPEEKVDRAVAGLLLQLEGVVEGKEAGVPKGRVKDSQVGLFSSLQDSAKYLGVLNKKLAGLASDKGGDQAAQRLVSAWVGFVEDEEPRTEIDRPAAAEKGKKGKKGKK